MKPILFNTEMVRAILDDRKTVTRRVVKDIPLDAKCVFVCDDYATFRWQVKAKNANIVFDKAKDVAPPYRPGDILYVRETWGYDKNMWIYRADFSDEDLEKIACITKWHPSIHMPREAARIFLRVTDVRVERLQTSFFEPICPIFAVQAEGIDIGDTCRECIENYGEPCCVDTVDEDGSDLYGGECGELDQNRGEFSDLWDSTIKPADRERYGWAANPWVWVIAF